MVENVNIPKRLIMKQPVVGSCTSHLRSNEYEPGCFNFTSKLEFEASSNLLHSRSDTCLRIYTSRTDTPHDTKAVLNPWTIPTIDFTLHSYKPKSSRFEARKNQSEQKKRKNKNFVKTPMPKLLEKPVIKEAPFITTFRSPSARTARIIGVKEGTHPAGPYESWGPHAFGGDDFRPDSGVRSKNKPPFVTAYPRDPRNLELQRKSISAHAGFGCLDGIGTKLKEDRPKPFVTSTNPESKWDHNLILTKERYQRGLSEDEIRMNRIMKQLSWYSLDKTAVPRLDRPNIRDYKTVDWLQVTHHSNDKITLRH